MRRLVRTVRVLFQENCLTYQCRQGDLGLKAWRVVSAFSHFALLLDRFKLAHLSEFWRTPQLTVHQLARTVHAHPTLAEGVCEAAQAVAIHGIIKDVVLGAYFCKKTSIRPHAR